MGGGMLFVPLLHYGAGWAIDGRIIAVSLVLTAIVSYGSGLTHRKEGYVDDSVVKNGLYGAIPGALLGVVFVSLIGSNLDIVFKSLSLVMIVWAIWKTTKKMKTDASESIETTREEDIQTTPLRVGAAIGGVLSSVLAIGAGVIYVPILRTFANLPPRMAIGSSLHFMMAVIPVSILAHIATLPSQSLEQLTGEAPFIALFAALTFIGARTGAQFGIKHLSEQKIMMTFLVLIVVVALRYIFDLVGF